MEARDSLQLDLGIQYFDYLKPVTERDCLVVDMQAYDLVPERSRKLKLIGTVAISAACAHLRTPAGNAEEDKEGDKQSNKAFEKPSLVHNGEAITHSLPSPNNLGIGGKVDKLATITVLSAKSISMHLLVNKEIVDAYGIKLIPLV